MNAQYANRPNSRSYTHEIFERWKVLEHSHRWKYALENIYTAATLDINKQSDSSNGQTEGNVPVLWQLSEKTECDVQLLLKEDSSTFEVCFRTMFRSWSEV